MKEEAIRLEKEAAYINALSEITYIEIYLTAVAGNDGGTYYNFVLKNGSASHFSSPRSYPLREV